MGQHTLTPIELSTLLLKKLKQSAEKFLEETCNEVVISVPAYFNNTQREATIFAAKLAGFTTLSLLSEPTAAAMSFGLHKLEEESLILVVDLGGGTFDVSLLQMFDGIMQVEAIAGDNHLGGEDFTHVIVQDCLRKNNLLDEIISIEDQTILYRKAELLKQQLTYLEPKKFNFQVMDKEFEYTLTMTDFEKISQHLLNRMRMPIIRVLNDAKYDITEVDRVLLIGGATKSDMVRKYISKQVGKIPFTQIHPDEAVGLGATIQSALKENKEMLEELILTDVCAYTLGTNVTKEIHGEFKSGFFEPIIERNTTIPVSKIETFCTIYDNQREVVFDIFQGENRMCEDNLQIGSLSIKVPKAPKGESVDVRFTYDTDGLLEVMATVVKTGKSEKVVIENNAGSLTAEEIAARFEKLSALKIGMSTLF